jgi:hypothetical protein
MAGSPKIPLPIIEFTASAARLQRPIARTTPVCEDVIASQFAEKIGFEVCISASLQLTPKKLLSDNASQSADKPVWYQGIALAMPEV